jgi:hypothetical protein
MHSRLFVFEIHHQERTQLELEVRVGLRNIHYILARSIQFGRVDKNTIVVVKLRGIPTAIAICINGVLNLAGDALVPMLTTLDFFTTGLNTIVLALFSLQQIRLLLLQVSRLRSASCATRAFYCSDG